MFIRSIDELEAGDIMISGQSTAPNKLLVYGGQFLLHEQFRIGKFAAGHAGVIVPPAVAGGTHRLVEAMPRGARVRNLRPTDWSDQHLYLRLPDDYPGQHIDAAAVAMMMVGVRYSFASYAYMGAYLGGFQPEWLAHRIDRRQDPVTRRQLPSGRMMTDALPLEAICSVLAEQSWTLTGKKVIEGTKPQVVSPGMLTGQLYGREGVVRSVLL